MKEDSILKYVLITAITCWTLVLVGIVLDYKYKTEESKRALVFRAMELSYNGTLDFDEMMEATKNDNGSDTQGD